MERIGWQKARLGLLDEALDFARLVSHHHAILGRVVHLHGTGLGLGQGKQESPPKRTLLTFRC